MILCNMVYLSNGSPGANLRILRQISFGEPYAMLIQRIENEFRQPGEILP